MKYTAINIGPVIPTLNLARKPRELWSASYLMSHLMRCIHEIANNQKIEIVAPEGPTMLNLEVGIFPDRIYFKGEFNADELLNEARNKFIQDVNPKKDKDSKEDKILDEKKFNNYFNLMVTICEAQSDSLAIAELNQKLDVMELCNYAADEVATDAIYRIISPFKKNESRLREIATKSNVFDMKMLAEIATAQLKEIAPDKWSIAKDKAKKTDEIIQWLNKECKKMGREVSNDMLIDLDDFYTSLGKLFVEEKNTEDGKKVSISQFKSYHKYFCVVQADGDNVGKTISHKDLKDKYSNKSETEKGDVQNISLALVEFGQKATEIITDYGGFPVYAGGDDLLFIAPIIGKKQIGKDEKKRYMNIFDLLEEIESNAFNGVIKAVNQVNGGNGITDDKNKKVEASLSFGVSISYYKYPLYEALEKARTLLFDKAKKVKDKKAVALCLRRHSGGTFEAVFSRNHKIMDIFENIINTSPDNKTVSAVAHKIRQEEVLVDMVLEECLANENRKRLNALFDKVLGFEDNKSTYIDKVKELMPILYKEVNKKDFPEALYCLLRIAKFINGEEQRDE